MSLANHSHYNTYRKSLESGETSVSETVRLFVTNIKEKKHLNAFLEVFEEEALDIAAKLDEKFRKGESVGKLAGMVIALKDNICYKGHTLSASSKILEGFTSLYSATAVERLLQEDAIIIGRTNCDEFAMGSSNENSAYGQVKNAIDETRVPGGSSGGSAVAVQAGLCHASLGSDTGGSIRQPASFCGIVGLKPTYGRISRHGLIAFGSSFDQIGPFTTNVYDAALLLEVMSGQDDYDSTVAHVDVANYATKLAYSGKKKFAYFPQCTEHEAIDPEVKQAFQQLKSSLENEGHEVVAVDFNYLDYLIPAYYVMTTAEASSNLARYDGIRYGKRDMEVNDMEEVYKRSRSQGFGEEVKRRIMLGTFVLSSGYYDAYYAQAQKVRRLVYDEVNALLEKYDAILSPTAPSPAFTLGEKSDDPVEMYLSDIFTVIANLTGHPSISLPLAKNTEGLPIGMQLTGHSFKEEDLLACAQYFMEKFNS